MRSGSGRCLPPSSLLDLRLDGRARRTTFEETLLGIANSDIQ